MCARICVGVDEWVRESEREREMEGKRELVCLVCVRALFFPPLRIILLASLSLSLSLSLPQRIHSQ